MTSVKEFFNTIAQNWDNSDNNYDVIDKLIKLVNIKKDADVLDLGCGKGVVTNRLYEYSNKQVYAIDVSEKMIEGALENYQDFNKYKFICGDFYNYDFDKSFDYIIIFNAYPHFMDVEGLAKRAYDLLNKNGHLVIMHDCPKELLNSHHKAKAMGVSRYLTDVKDEASLFNKYFDTVKTIDNNECFYMDLIKKN